MTYTPTKWVNGGKPAINAENLNKIEEALAQLSVPDITETTSTTQPNSYAGRENILEIGGVTEQGENPSPTNPMEIKKSVVSGIKTHWKNFINQACVSANEAGKHFLKAGTYTVTRDASEVGNSWYLGAYDSNNNVITENTLVAQGFGISSTKEYWFGGSIYATTTFTINVDCYVKIGVLNGSGKTYLMLNEGTTALPYEPYTESSYTFSQPIELYGMGDVQDVIKSGNVERGWTKKRVTSAMDIFRNTGWGEGSFSVQNFFSDGLNIADYATKANMLCTHARIGVPASVADGASVNAIAHGGGAGLYINFDNCTTVDELKTFLDENEVYVYYQLATPTTEALPIADQIGLNSLATYDGITYVEFDSEIQPTFKAEYGTSKVGGYTLEAMLAGRNGELRGV